MKSVSTHLVPVVVVVCVVVVLLLLVPDMCWLASPHFYGCDEHGGHDE